MHHHLAAGRGQASATAQRGEVELSQCLRAVSHVGDHLLDERPPRPAVHHRRGGSQSRARDEALLDRQALEQGRLAVAGRPVRRPQGGGCGTHPRYARPDDLARVAGNAVEAHPRDRPWPEVIGDRDVHHRWDEARQASSVQG